METKIFTVYKITDKKMNSFRWWIATKLLYIVDHVLKVQFKIMWE
jgi:hypothetical protein